MRIDIQRFKLQLRDPWTIARGLATGGDTEVEVLFLRLTAPDGTVGLGEAAPIERYHESIASNLDFFAKLDASRLSFEDLEGSLTWLESLPGGQPSARCAVDLALHDGAARLAGTSVGDFLGLPFPAQDPLTSYSIGIAEPEEIRRKVRAAADFPILKLKLGSPGDRENLAALRDVAPEKTLRVDGNEAWKDRETALRQLEWLAEDPLIEFVEQPMPAGTPVEDLVWLKERSPLPLMADESYCTAANLEVCRAAYDSVNVKLVKCGGLAPGRRALEAARAAGMKTMLGCMIESSLLISAASHLAPLTNFRDLDSPQLIDNDPSSGIRCRQGGLYWAETGDSIGLRARLDPRLDSAWIPAMPS